MRAYQDMVYATAARLTSHGAQAEDITQEVFLKAYEHFETLEGSATAGGWLKTVATHLTLNHLSRYRKRWRMFSELDDGSGEPAEIEAAAATFDELLAHTDAESRASLVRRALEQLPAHQRVPLVLFHFEDMPYQEIAGRLGVSLAKVKTDILRGRLALARWLNAQGVTSPG